MDPTRFDALARSFTPSASRRTTLLGLLAGLVVSVIPGLEAEAKRRKRQGKGKTGSHDAPRAGSGRVGIEKKKHKKKKKKPAPCASACTGARNCGSDDCGGSCGSCTAPQTCGGGGTPGVCGCTPLNACPIGQTCGTVPDGCGGTIACGTCTTPQTCGGGDTPGVCGSPGCPNCLNANGTPRNCGDDGCGGSCGSCVGDNYECEPTFGFCGCRLHNDIALCEGICVNVRASQEHCGRCDNSCYGRTICCDGWCSDPLRDNGNCGGCGVVCPTDGMGGAHYACCGGSCTEAYHCPGE